MHGSREFVEHLRNWGKFFDHEEKRERDLMLIVCEGRSWKREDFEPQRTQRLQRILISKPHATPPFAISAIFAVQKEVLGRLET